MAQTLGAKFMIFASIVGALTAILAIAAFKRNVGF
jgi:hypothetical protein